VLLSLPLVFDRQVGDVMKCAVWRDWVRQLLGVALPCNVFLMGSEVCLSARAAWCDGIRDSFIHIPLTLM
jgi:hypothetical protein